jgi:rRNA maturation endonuclease Nob1
VQINCPDVNDDRPRRPLKERTGKHLCIECLKEVPAEDYFRNDHVCQECGEKKERKRDDADRGHP